jgi:hypothetical protein
MESMSTFNTQVDDVLAQYKPSLESKAGMRAYEDELLAAMERNAQLKGNQQTALFAFDPSQPTGFFDKLQQYMQLSLMLSQVAAPQYTEQIAMDMQAMTGQAPQISTGSVELAKSDNTEGRVTEEAPTVEKAREQAEMASQPV